MAVLTGAGVSIHEALDTLSSLQGDPLSLWVTPDLYKKVTSGHRLSSAMARYPRVFSPTYVALIRASEETGKISPSLEQLGEWLDRRTSVERHMKKALSYPVTVIVVAFILTVALFNTVVPDLLHTVMGLGVELPVSTQILVWIVFLFKQPLFWCTLVILITVTFLQLSSERGYKNLLIFATHVPGLGPVLITSGAARYAFTLSLLVDSGVDLQKACAISGQASGNPILDRDSKRVIEGIKAGESFPDLLKSSRYYPALLADMIHVGVESGKLSNLLGRSGDLLQDSSLYRVDTFLSVMEPALLSLVSMAVGFVIVALLLPLSSVVSAI